MISSLKNYFKDNIIVNDFTSNTNDYLWFTNDSDDVIGLKKSAVTEEAAQLINIFLRPIAHESLNYTKEQLKWAHFLFDGNSDLFVFQPKKTVRITQLFFSQPCGEKETFEQLFLTCFPNFSTILWKSNQYAVALDFEETLLLETEVVSSFIQSVSTDFYTDLQLFTGNTITMIKELYDAYQFELQAFETVRAIHKRPFFTLQNALPYLFGANLPESLIHSIKTIWLEELQKDIELQYFFTKLFENNLNVSHTAKQLFLHRNTLLYRIDKFYEKTGFDVRIFSHALTIYLCINYFSFHENSSL